MPPEEQKKTAPPEKRGRFIAYKMKTIQTPAFGQKYLPQLILVIYIQASSYYSFLKALIYRPFKTKCQEKRQKLTFTFYNHNRFFAFSYYLIGDGTQQDLFDRALPMGSNNYDGDLLLLFHP